MAGAQGCCWWGTGSHMVTSGSLVQRAPKVRNSLKGPGKSPSNVRGDIWTWSGRRLRGWASKSEIFETVSCQKYWAASPFQNPNQDSVNAACGERGAARWGLNSWLTDGKISWLLHCSPIINLSLNILKQPLDNKISFNWEDNRCSNPHFPVPLCTYQIPLSNASVLSLI